MDKAYLKAHVAVLSANLLYGVNYVIAKEIMPTYMSASGLTFVRVCFSTVLLWLTGLFFATAHIERKDMWRVALAGILGVGLNQYLFMAGLSLSSPIDAAIIMTTNPIMVLFISFIVLHEILTPIKILGVLIGASGAVLLVLFNSQNVSISGNASGNLLLLLNSVAYAFYLVLVKPIMVKYPSITAIKWIFLWGAVFYIPFGFHGFTQIDFAHLPASIIWSVVFVVIGTTYFTYLLNLVAMKTLKPSTVSIYIYSQPIIAGLTAAIMGVDRLTWIKVVSAALVFSGVYMVSVVNFRASKKHLH